MRIALLVASITILSAGLAAQPASSLSATVREFVLVDAPVVALTHVQVVDGTGAPAASDQTIVLRAGRIAAVGPSDTVAVPGGERGNHRRFGMARLDQHFARLGASPRAPGDLRHLLIGTFARAQVTAFEA